MLGCQRTTKNENPRNQELSRSVFGIGTFGPNCPVDR